MTVNTKSKSMKPSPRVRASAKEAPSSSKDIEALKARLNQSEQLKDRVTEMPAADHKRVAALQEAIEAGTYQVDPLRVAQKMADMEVILSDFQEERICAKHGAPERI